MSGRARFFLLGWLNAPPKERGTACGIIDVRQMGGEVDLTNQVGGQIDLRPRIGGENSLVFKEPRIGGDVVTRPRIGGTIDIERCQEETDSCE